ncbi:flagellar protein FlaG [Stutzerimonas kunmingensis]|jgi:flagellar protein FlaG|uniref:flagellar protein FlaG n=1 Tax=Stutzerimonas kunmingensis TaxID=1211807 RepID=UPI001EB677B4|nr:flagellar protein FlaG [Stutzerimonas kunmingensis]MBF6615118.1 flagellar protein FlaG [Candidimonas sp.]
MDVGRVAGGLVRPETVATSTPPGSVKEAGGFSLEGFRESQHKTDGTSEVARAELEAQVSDVLSRLQMVQRDLDFNIDDSTGQVVVKVIDSESGKLVRQIPSKELLELAERFEEMRSLMESVKA